MYKRQVYVDTTFLDTLPENELKSGYAEMLKHGLIQSEGYWEALKSFDVKNKESTKQLIWESIFIKDQIVTQDPNERGIRKMLNFGHTLGHAIESYCLSSENRNTLLHGEAIAIGMILALFISSELTGFNTKKMISISKSLLYWYQKETFTNQEIAAIIELLKFDKKNKGGEILFVLLEDFGVHKTNQKAPNTLIYSAFDFYKNL